MGLVAIFVANNAGTNSRWQAVACMHDFRQLKLWRLNLERETGTHLQRLSGRPIALQLSYLFAA